VADVFISYKAEDRRRVRPLVEALEKEGLAVWWDAHVGAGQEWRERIAGELETAKCVIVAWSKGAVGPNGRFVRDEATRALRRGVYVPITLDRVEPPLGFGETQALPLLRWTGDRSDAAYLALLAAVTAVVRGEARQPADTDVDHSPSRRALLVGSAAAGTALAAGAGWFWLRRDELSPEAQRLVEEAREGVDDGGVEVNANAIAKLRRAADLEPESGIVWGLLALAYVQQARVAPNGDRASLVARGLAAAKRSQSLERYQPEGMAAQILAMPVFRNWYAVDRACHAALEKHPDNPYLLWRLAELFGQVGRHEECLSVLDKVLKRISTPMHHVGRLTLLWNLGRLDEAEAELDRTFSLWPRHFAVWFSNAYYLMYNGRAREALAFMNDTANRPIGIPSWNFDLVISQAHALADDSRATIGSSLEALESAAHKSSGFAENAAIFASFTREFDAAFRILMGLYTNRGFAVGDAWFSAEQAIYQVRERNTFILFERPMMALRQDPRFHDLSREIGLADYWEKTKSRGRVIA
jgi:tetratricopeptide (TPR) repeat protein